MVTGWDLVEWQVRIAAGEPRAAALDDFPLHGHAIEARVYAEDAARGFLPTGGPVLGLSEPVSEGVRVDSGLRVGTVVGSDYDPMLAKVIAHGPDRAAALAGLDRALTATAVLGVVTNIDFLRFLLADPEVQAGTLDTGLLDRRVGDYNAPAPDDQTLIAAGAYRWLQRWAAADDDLWSVPSGWRMGGPAPTVLRLQSGERTDHVAITGTPEAATATVEHGERHSLTATLDGDQLILVIDGLRTTYRIAETDHQIWLAGGGGVTVVQEVREAPVRPDDEHSGDAELISPMPGAVVAVNAASGDTVTAGTVVVAVEAMKMEHSLTAPVDGVVEVLVAVGDQVKVGQPLARISATEKEATDD
jgi:acetyl-CoA/propionyl-CoA carboxylase biotin carboxyl carrier protein